MRASRLHDHHARSGATFEEVAGWTVPLHYGDPTGEHHAVRQSVGLADLSHRGKSRVTGEDRIKWLQSIISNDILPLQHGQGRYSSFLTHKGKMISYFRCYMETDVVILEDVGEIGDATYAALRKFLLYGTKAKIENCSETWGLLLVGGPHAASVIQTAFGAGVGDLMPVDFTSATIAGQSAMIIASEETGERDFEILIPSDGLVAAWERLMEAGSTFGIIPVGRQALEALRIEAGIPRTGADLNEDIVPPEANLESKAFSLNKGCYPGQEVVARMDTYGNVRRKLVGLVLKDATVPPKGSKLFSGDREIGWISSAVYSPQMNSVIALGFPLRDFSNAGSAVSVEIDGTRHDAAVYTLPFYQKT
ncbi:putative Aminomethyltransferase, glycine cleavage system T protein [Nitrospira sp. KM1]|uniref:CAF17-like 4Fe-4S cluster assembly/insertion protein YgfZ n=1 Tax=Nitrospira sp. KM1 TaxID=1936990 RepID=UPI0013A79F76|nr:aminomethyltransferase family protein [Nitrospira sp. KM1]BCA56198.1 putative Aminomethyltransferase, glycine cleavage system T protein [Nitrospira sp. KM1]